MMKTLLLATCAAALGLAATPAFAGIVSDAQGDWAPGYTGQKLNDLDVKAFSVAYDSGASLFHLKGTMWGNITAGTEGFYVIGVDTGSGPSHPFGALGQPNVTFNGVMLVQKDGTGTIGATSLTSMITIAGDTFNLDIPLSLLPASTGFDAMHYGFNLWPRGAGAQAVADFAPENSTLSAAVPEAGTWAMMVAGFVVLGGTMRTRRRTAAFA
jgi:hypothetical protein